MNLPYPLQWPPVTDQQSWVRQYCRAEIYHHLQQSRNIYGSRAKVLVKDLSQNYILPAGSATVIVAAWLVRFSLEISRVTGDVWLIYPPTQDYASSTVFLETEAQAGGSVVTGDSVYPPNDFHRRPPGREGGWDLYGRGLINHNQPPNDISGTTFDYGAWTEHLRCTVVPDTSVTRLQYLRLKYTGPRDYYGVSGPIIAGLVAWEEIDRV